MAEAPAASGRGPLPTARRHTVDTGREPPRQAQLAARVEAAGGELRRSREGRWLRGAHFPERVSPRVPGLGSSVLWSTGPWPVCGEDSFWFPYSACPQGAFLKIKGIDSGFR